MTVSDSGAVIGRAAQCDVVVSSPAVSRQHARIEKSGDRYFVQDLQSRNGVLVNQRPIGGRVELRDGDRIRLADVVFTFQEKPHKDDTLGKGRLPTQFDLEEEEQWTDQSTIGPRPPEVKLASLDDRYRALISFGQRLSQLDLHELTFLPHSGGAGFRESRLGPVLSCMLDALPAAESVFVLLQDESRNDLREFAARARKGEPAMLGREAVSSAWAALETGAPKLTAAAGSKLLDKHLMRREYFAPLSLRKSHMCAPLVAPGEPPFGALVAVSNSQAAGFDLADLELFVDMGRQIGEAIALARLRERLVSIEHLRADLRIAGDVQRAMLPQRRPTIDGYELADFLQSHSSIGGDYFDYVELADGRVALAVADVAGKGAPAALIAARLSASFPLHLAASSSLAEALSRISADLLRVDSNRFVTMAALVLDPRSHQVVAVSAGHLAPIRIAEGVVEPVGEKVSGVPLGLGDFPYEEVRFQLQPGEALLLFTDGLIEASGPDRKRFGQDRLCQQTLKSGRTAQEQVDAILSEAERWRQGENWPDDVCLVCLRRLPEERALSRLRPHALFDPESAYSRLRSAFVLADKTWGYFLFRRQAAAQQAVPAGQPPTILVLAVSAAAETAESDRAGALVRRLAAGETSWGFRDSAASREGGREFFVSLTGLPTDASWAGVLCRVLIVEVNVLARLRKSAPEIEAMDAGAWLEALLASPAFASSSQAARILSALPEMESRLSDAGGVSFAAKAPEGASGPGPGSLIVVLLDASRQSQEH